MRIGEVAARAGVNVQTLRYYERRGLLPEPDRTSGNYRRYHPDAVARVRFIKRAQTLGFDLQEVQDLLRLHDTPGMRPLAVRALAESKVAVIDRRIAELSRMRGVLQDLVEECKRKAGASCCPILEALDGSEAARRTAMAEPSAT